MEQESTGIPQCLRIGAFDITVIEWDPIAANAQGKYGEFSALELSIRIDASARKGKLIDSLLHEINHAIFWAYRIEDDDKEERIVDIFAHGWCQVYRDNPLLLAWITDTVNTLNSPLVVDLQPREMR